MRLSPQWPIWYVWQYARLLTPILSLCMQWVGGCTNIYDNSLSLHLASYLPTYLSIHPFSNAIVFLLEIFCLIFIDLLSAVFLIRKYCSSFFAFSTFCFLQIEISDRNWLHCDRDIHKIAPALLLLPLFRLREMFKPRVFSYGSITYGQSI